MRVFSKAFILLVLLIATLLNPFFIESVSAGIDTARWGTENNVVNIDNFESGVGSWAISAAGSDVVNLSQSSLHTDSYGLTSSTKSLKVDYTFVNDSSWALFRTFSNTNFGNSQYLIIPIYFDSTNSTSFNATIVLFDSSNRSVTVKSATTFQAKKWNYFGVNLANVTWGTVDKTVIKQINITTNFASQNAVFYVDDIRLLDYAYSDPTLATDGEMSTAEDLILDYYFEGPGIEHDSGAANFGVMNQYNLFTRSRVEWTNNEQDVTMKSGNLLSYLSMKYRMTKDQTYMDMMDEIVNNYFLRYYVKSGLSKGYMPYWIDASGNLFNDTSTDQYQFALDGLQNYFYLTGGTNAELKTLFADFAWWWNNGKRRPDGSTEPDGIAPVINSTANIAGGDATYTVDTTLTTARTNLYTSAVVGTSNLDITSGYNLSGNYYLNYVRNRVRYRKDSSVLATQAANALDEYGLVGDNTSYSNNLNSRFTQHPRGHSWNGHVDFNGTTDLHEIAAQPYVDSFMNAESIQAVYAILNLSLITGTNPQTKINGSNSGNTLTEEARKALGYSIKYQITDPTDEYYGGLPWATLTPYLVYEGVFNSTLTDHLSRLGEQNGPIWLMAYGYYELLTQYDGLFPRSDWERVWNWQYDPADGSLTMLLSGQNNDSFDILVNNFKTDGTIYKILNTTSSITYPQITGESQQTLDLTMSGNTMNLAITESKLNLDPATQSVTAEILSESTNQVEWEMDSAVDQDVDVTISDMPPNTAVTVTKDGAAWNTYTSNGSGVVTFTYDEGFSSHTFEAEAVQAAASSNPGLSGSTSSASPPVCSTAKPTGKPNLYSVLPKSPTSVELSFSYDGASYDHFILEYGTSSGEYQFGAGPFGGPGTTKYTVEGLTSGQTYYFRLRAGNNCATGEFSPEISSKPRVSGGTNLIKPDLEIVSSKLTPVGGETTKDRCENYTVQAGDTLWSIAASKLGAGENYQQIIDENKTAYTSLADSSNLKVGWELKLNCQEEQKEEAASVPADKTYTVQVKVVDTEKKAVGGASVTLHSTPRTAQTNQEGIATFENVEGGEHRVIIAYQGYEGEQSVYLEGDVKEFDLNIEVKPVNYFKNPWVLGVIGFLVLVILALIALLFKRGYPWIIWPKNSLPQKDLA